MRLVRLSLMSSTLNRFLCLLVFALPASAQLDSAQLQAKFGAPLHREVFRIPPGFDLVVDYGADNQVCRLQVPDSMPPDLTKKSWNTDEQKQKMRAFLAELVPGSLRGKVLNRMFAQSGAFSGRGVDEYEKVTVLETYSGSSDTITLTFKDAGCQQPDQTAR